MYFTRQLGNVYHILDEKTDRAPIPCGARLEKVALLRLRAGESSRFVMADEPAHIPLCKHCSKSQLLLRSKTEGARMSDEEMVAQQG